MLKDVGDAEKELDINYTQGRVWWGDRLVVQRDRGTGKLQYREEILKHLNPSIDTKMIEEVSAKIKMEKEEERAKQ